MSTIKEVARLHGFRSMLYVPLMKGVVPIGIITVTRVETGAFAPHHIKLLQAFADQVQAFLAPRRGLRQIHRLNEILYAAQAAYTEPEFGEAFAYLRTRHERWDRLGRAAAEVGVVFTTLVLVTGSIWGYPIWGTWWSWDPKLTTTLILWFLYLGYLMLRSYAEAPRGPRYAAILGIVGFVDTRSSADGWLHRLQPRISLTTLL